MNKRDAKREALYFLASCAEQQAATGGVSEDLSDADEQRICLALMALAEELRRRANNLSNDK